jgi:hypothetical protein
MGRELPYFPFHLAAIYESLSTVEDDTRIDANFGKAIHRVQVQDI